MIAQIKQDLSANEIVAIKNYLAMFSLNSLSFTATLSSEETFRPLLLKKFEILSIYAK